MTDAEELRQLIDITYSATLRARYTSSIVMYQAPVAKPVCDALKTVTDAFMAVRHKAMDVTHTDGKGKITWKHQS